MDLTNKELLQALTKAERDMDSGLVPWVRIEGGLRIMVDAAVMEEFGLVSGQTVSSVMARAITEAHLRMVLAQIALDKVVGKV